jgi:translocation and assembly module TamA
LPPPSPQPRRRPHPAPSPPRAAALLLLAALSGCLTPRGTAERPLVTELRIDGARAVSSEEIEKGLATQQSNLPWLPFFGEPRYLERDALPTDLKRIERFYRAKGYYGARVTGTDLVEHGRGRVEVVVHVEEGEPVKVEDVTVTGLEGIAPEVAARAGRVHIHKGDVFTERAYDAGRDAILDALRSSGYARAAVEQQALVDEVERQALISYQVSPGERFRFGNVFVAGTAVVPRNRVRDEAQLAVKPGEYFNPEKLQDAQSRVFDLGVFGGVRVSQGTPDTGKQTIPVVVAVREAPFRTVRIGPGVAIQATRWEANATASWTHRNWFGGLRKLSVDARVGYAWIPSPLQRQAKQGVVGLASVDFAQPGAIRRFLDLAARLELQRGLEEAFDYTSERLRLSTPLRLRRWTLVPSYNLELYQLSGTVTVIPGSGTPEILSQCRGEFCLLSYLEQRVTWDGRDDPVNTRSGLYASLAFQEGFRLFGNGFPYLRVIPEARAFWRLGDKLVLAFRGRVGALVPFGNEDSPIVARFAAGGPNSMRGYYTRRLSPMGISEGEFVPVGGEQLTEGTLELRFPIAGELGAALFLDAGDVRATSAANGSVVQRMVTSLVGAIDPRNLQYAAGVGLRYATPFGPVRLDVGVRLPRRDDGQWVVPEVPGGGHTEPIVAVHISLGEAF